MSEAPVDLWREVDLLTKPQLCALLRFRRDTWSCAAKVDVHVAPLWALSGGRHRDIGAPADPAAFLERRLTGYTGAHGHDWEWRLTERGAQAVAFLRGPLP